ncbi:hypothetical protein LSH36_225g02022 [Paralvinella palmiformis]|uniref:Uncharacterized protein n=1 Tax=Paralvinella palmiformis TaxID=53620 RepID=A0AAD9N5Q0_9ANNE|nr:hypothetical protein LSH36_225g02022 [Paralvinella palmiformis]
MAIRLSRIIDLNDDNVRDFPRRRRSQAKKEQQHTNYEKQAGSPIPTKCDPEYANVTPDAKTSSLDPEPKNETKQLKHVEGPSGDLYAVSYKTELKDK